MDISMRVRKIVDFQSRTKILFVVILFFGLLSQTFACPNVNKQEVAQEQNIYKQVTELERSGKTAEAINKARSAIDSGDVTPALLILLAKLYEKNSELDNALFCYQRAKETMGASFFSVPTNLSYSTGNVLYQLKRYKESIDYLEHACRHNSYNPDDPKAYEMLAYAYDQEGYSAESYQSYLTLLSVQPSNPTAWEAISRIKQTGKDLTINRQHVPMPIANIEKLVTLGNPSFWGTGKLREGVSEYVKMSEELKKNGHAEAANQFLNVIFAVSTTEGISNFKAKNYSESIRCFSFANQARSIKSLPPSVQKQIWNILFFSHWRVKQYIQAITMAEEYSNLPVTKEERLKQINLLSEFIREVYDSVSWNLQTQSPLSNDLDEFPGHLVPFVTHKVKPGEEQLYFVPYGMTSRSEDLPSMGEQIVSLQQRLGLEKEVISSDFSVYRFMTAYEHGKFIDEQINKQHFEFPLKVLLFKLYLISSSYQYKDSNNLTQEGRFNESAEFFGRLNKAIENSALETIRETTLDAFSTIKKTISILINLDRELLANNNNNKLPEIKKTLQEKYEFSVLTETYFLKAPHQSALVINTDFVNNNSLDFAGNLESMAEHFFQNDYSIKEQIYRTTLKIREKVLGPQHEKVARSLLSLANILLKEKKNDEAMLFLNKALEIKDGLKDVALAGAVNSLASLYEDKADYEQAENLYKKALKICEESMGVQSILYAGTLNNLGGLYYFKEQFAEAKEAMEKSLSIREKLPNPDDSEIANSLSSLGLLYNKLGDTNKAEENYRRALSLYEKKNKADTPDVLSAISNLASLLSYQRKFEEAQNFLKKALLICERSFGKDSLATTDILTSTANNFFWQGKYDEAEEISLRVLSIMESHLGKTDPRIAFAIDNTAAVLFYNRKYTETENLLKRNLSIYLEAYSEKHQNVALALDKLAIFYRYTSKPVLAEEYYRKALLVMDNLKDCNVSTKLYILESYVDFLQSINRAEEASLLLKRIVSIKDKKK